MIDKPIRACFWDNDRPAAQLLNTFSRGLDTDQLQKLGVDSSVSGSIVPEKGFSYLRLITTGAGEFYAPNTNADFFNETFRQHYFPAAPFQKTASLDGGLKKYHRTYKEFGAVFREHNNFLKKASPQGSIEWEGYNEPMHWGELIIKVANDAWADDLQDMAEGKPLLWSQGCGVKYDWCSRCMHKAASVKDYCACLRFNKLAIDKDGYQTYAINDAPHFHDISRVRRPADRIAFALQKVANTGGVRTYDDLDMLVSGDMSGLYIPMSMLCKIASGRHADRVKLLHKMSEMEKQLPLRMEEVVPGKEAFTVLPEDEKHIVDSLSGIPEDKILRMMGNHNMMMTPRCFIQIIIRKNPDEMPEFPEMLNSLPSIFTDLGNASDTKDIEEDSSYTPSLTLPDAAADRKIASLDKDLSMDPDAIQHRIVKVVYIKGKEGDKKEKSSKKIEKAASEETRAAGMLLAKEYAKYQLAYLEKNASDVNFRLVAAANRLAHTIL